tara:strand:+ start:709 stop:1209 length:501 start_codon:yes stop_codon:yes gene_type:complete
MNLRRTRQAMNDFAKYVIQQSRSNLTKGNKNVTKKLYNSLDKKINKTKTGLELSFEMLEYGLYQDKGVSGTKKKYDTPFKYTNKRPPSSAFDKWNVRKGIAPRGRGGQFAKRKGLNYVIAKSIFEQGIKPSLFFTKPFEKRFNNFINELQIGVADDFENDLQDEKG